MRKRSVRELERRRDDLADRLKVACHPALRAELDAALALVLVELADRTS